MQDRVEQALTAAEAEGLEALALVPGPNLRYLLDLGFFMSERPIVALLPIDRPPVIVLPELEAGKASAAGLEAFPYNDEEGYALAFHAACAAVELVEARVGVEALRMRVLESRILARSAPNVDLVPVDALFAEMRMTKTVDELNAMRRAVEVAEEAFLSWVAMLREGMTEREAAARLTAALLGGGADALAFDPIVASGPNGALPHAVPGDRTFRKGDWIVVDWGATVDGYKSDLTRAVVVGPPEGQLRRIHELVVAANAAGREVVAPGVTAAEVDAATREVIMMGGHGPEFFHRTGHGLGLEEHEPPYIVRGSDLRLRPGMTFTVEPGVYLEGVGGVRIEDDVVVTERGGETLTTLERAPFFIHV